MVDDDTLVNLISNKDWGGASDFLSAGSPDDSEFMANIFGTDGHTGLSTLNRAFFYNAPEDISTSLIGYGGKKLVMFRGGDGSTVALSNACYKDPSVKIIELLFDTGGDELVADIFHQDGDSGETVLHTAVEHSAKPGVLEILVQKGGKKLVTLQDFNGNTALHLACYHQRGIEVVKILTNVVGGKDIVLIANREDKEAHDAARENGGDQDIMNYLTDIKDGTIIPGPVDGINRRGQNLLSDNAAGPDHLGVEPVAHELAEYLASASLEPPFVLGILGKWGTGKSYFFNLMKKRLIELQKMEVKSAEENPHAGHMYCITFDAWTYGKDNLWASLMYRIFKDLSVQLQLESMINDKRKDDPKDGRLSMIELVDKLSTAEMEYLEDTLKEEIKGDKNIVQRLIDYDQRQGERVSKSFSAVFKEQVESDKKDIEDATKKLEEETNMTIWKALEKDWERNKKTFNVIEEIIIKKITTAAVGDSKSKLKALNLQKKTLREIRAKFTLIENVTAFLRINSLIKFFTLLFLFAIIIGAVALWETYGEILYAKVAVSLGSVATFVGALCNVYKKGKDYVNNCADEFAGEIKAAQEIGYDIESTYLLANAEIQTEKKKIAEIKRRLTIIEGESMQSVVKDRVESDVYLDKLGIVHQAKEDLDRLNDAMSNKYHQEIKKTKLGNGNKPSPADPQEAVDPSESKPIDSREDDMNEKSDNKPEYETGCLDFRNNPSPADPQEAVDPSPSPTGPQEVVDPSEIKPVDSREDDMNEKSDDEPEHETGCLTQCLGFLKRKLGNGDKPSTANPQEAADPSVVWKPMFPRGKPRIVVFVDDLDRCEPDKVVEVLEAMQLLVKTDLFVVVAAIDLRYVCLSLEQKKRYKHILNSDNSPTGLEYIEKIIQIPYRLPIISDKGMKNFIEAQKVQSKKKEGKPLARPPTPPIPIPKPPGPQNRSEPEEVVQQPSDPEEMEWDSKEVDILNEACRIFKPCARSVKRVVNVFKIMKIVWHKERMRDQNLKEHSILLLVMASASFDRPRRGMQKIFNLMEKDTMPKSTTDGAEPRDLKALIKKHCLVNDEKDGLLEGLDKLKFKDDAGWRVISDKFQYVRSFSFFRVRDDNVDKKNEEDSDDE